MASIFTKRWQVRWLRPFQIDVRSLAAMRIALGLTLLYELAWLVPMTRTYFTDWGVLPRNALAAASAKASLYWLSGSFGWAIFLVWLEILATLMLLFGFQTRVASVALVVLISSVINRNPLFIHAGQQLQIWLMVWSIFLPLGAAASVDKQLVRSSASAPRVRRIVSLASLAILWQVVFVYFSSVTAKSGADWTTDFSALYFSLRSHFATPLGYQLSRYPNALGVLTLATLLLEGLGPIIAMLAYGMPRVRTLVVFSFIAFHIGILLTIYIGTFSLTCCSAWLLFLPPAFWDTLERLTLWRSIGAGWNAIVAAIAGGVEQVARFVPFVARRTIAGLHVHRVSWAFVGTLFAYIVLVNIVYDAPTAIARLAGPLNRIPRLKQNWGVISSGWKAYSGIAIDVTLANGTTHTLTAWDLPGDVFRWTLVLRPARSDYFQFVLWPPEYPLPSAYRGMMLSNAHLRIDPVRAFSDFHRRRWDEAHADPQQKIVSLKSYWVLDATTPPNMSAAHPVPPTRILQYTWPEVAPVKK